MLELHGFQPGLLFRLSRPVGFLQIACAVGPLGAGLGCCYMKLGILLYAALYVVLLEAGWNYGLLELDFPLWLVTSGLLP